MPRECPPEGELVAAVARLLRPGLPVTPATADPALLTLRGVAARAVDPADTASRTIALDGLLRRVLARFDDARYAEAARALFGLPPAAPGQLLTTRREVAARVAGHEVHHFRKRVEPRLVERIAWLLCADAQEIARSYAVAPRLASIKTHEVLPADPFAWEVAEHEEVLSRLWSAVYVLRAELLTVERMISMDAPVERVTPVALTALWRTGLLFAQAAHYASAYGPGLLGSDTELAVLDLVALAGWTPKLTPEQIALLTEVAEGHSEEAAFVARLYTLPGADDLVTAWRHAFSRHGAQHRRFAS